VGQSGPRCPRGKHFTAGEPPLLILFPFSCLGAKSTDGPARQVEDDIEGCFQRPSTIDIAVNSREYGPTAGIKPLREAVAHLYNEHHRKGKDSLYTWENVAIVPGGRAGLIRIAAVLNNAYVGFFIPDYTGGLICSRCLLSARLIGTDHDRDHDHAQPTMKCYHSLRM